MSLSGSKVSGKTPQYNTVATPYQTPENQQNDITGGNSDNFLSMTGKYNISNPGVEYKPTHADNNMFPTEGNVGNIILGQGGGYNWANARQAGGSKGGNQSWYPAAVPYLNQFMGVGNEWLKQSDPTGGELQGRGQQNLLNAAKGDFNNPYLEAASAGIQQQGAQRLGEDLTASDRGAVANGMLNSSKAGQNRAVIGRNSTQSVNDQLANLFGANYATGRQNQINAIAPTIAQGDINQQRALEIARLFAGMGTSYNKSQPSMLGSII